MSYLHLDYLLKNFPLRVSLTDYCNIGCFFCSNEGMDLHSRNMRHANLGDLIYLLDLLTSQGLQHLSLTGGEPTLYVHLKELLAHLQKHESLKTKFFHTNGIGLTPDLVQNYLGGFSKIAVSIHALEFETWNKLTGGSRYQFKILNENLSYLAEYKKKNPQVTIELKVVPLAGINDNPRTIRNILEYCSANQFFLKFLNFEPIVYEHLPYKLDVTMVQELVRELGGVLLNSNTNTEFRGQDSYLPFNRFRYGGTTGVIIEIGCGSLEVCRACANSNEIFLTPKLEIKPCHASSFTIPLSALVTSRDHIGIFKAFTESRRFLATEPGKGITHWQYCNDRISPGQEQCSCLSSNQLITS